MLSCAVAEGRHSVQLLPRLICGGDIVGGRFHLVMCSSGGSPHRTIVQNGPVLFFAPVGWRKPDGFGAATEGNVATQILTLLTVSADLTHSTPNGNWNRADSLSKASMKLLASSE